MTSLVNKSGHWTPNYHKILIFSPPKSLKSLRAARIDELADSNEPAISILSVTQWATSKKFNLDGALLCGTSYTGSETSSSNYT